MLYFCNDSKRSEVRHMLYGRYSQTGFVVIQKQHQQQHQAQTKEKQQAHHRQNDQFTRGRNDRIRMFGTSMGGVFREYQNTADVVPDHGVDLLEISGLQLDEKERILRTCEACCAAKIPFNLKDLLLMHVPMREVVDTPLWDARTLNNCQAVILILRECLAGTEHPLIKEGVLGSLHSRQTLVETLYDRVQPYTRMGLLRN